MLTTQKTKIFSDFWMAGYECADHLNKFGNRVNLLADTGHMEILEEDYNALSGIGIHTVREGICWSIAEPAPYSYEWSTVSKRIIAARQVNMKQVWDICHFGYPADLTPLHPHFSARFTALCVAFLHEYRKHQSSGPLYIVPINEISFLSWLGGEACGTAPFCVRQGWEVKYHLCKSFIQAVDAMRAIDDNIIVLATEPLIHVAAGGDAEKEQQAYAAQINEEQFQAMDILTGSICPELGGSSNCVDIAGVNFYPNNQWIQGSECSMPWKASSRHEQWKPLHILLKEVYDRYGKPVLLAETSHTAAERPEWITYIGEECSAALKNGTPLEGICIYPITDRPDWDYPEHWHRSGLWDETALPQPGTPQRILYSPYATALQEVQQHVAATLHSIQSFNSAIVAEHIIF